MMQAIFTLLFLIALLAHSASGQAGLVRINVGPGQGPRIDYREEDWKFWWFLNQERLLANRYAELRAGDTRAVGVPVTDADRLAIREALQESLESATPELSTAVLMALARGENREVFPWLIEHIDDENHEVRRAATRALGVLGDPAALLPLREILFEKKREQGLRTDAALALSLLKDTTAPTVDSSADPDLMDRPVEPLAEYPASQPISSLQWRPGTTQLSVTHPDGSVTLLFSSEGATTDPIGGDDNGIRASAWDASGEQLALARNDGGLTVWNARSDKSVQRLENLNELTALSWEPMRGERLVAAFQDGTARVLVPEKGRLLAQFTQHEGPLTCIAWQPDAERIASGAKDGTVRIWFARSGKQLAWTDQGGQLTALAWRPDGGLLASASTNGSLLVWEATPGTEPGLFLNGATPILDVGWSTDGTRLAVARQDGRIDLYDVKTRARISRFEGFEGGAVRLAWSPDNRRLCGLSGDSSLRLFPVVLPGGGVAGDTIPATPVAESLLELLEPKTFFQFESIVRTGIAMATGISGRPELGNAVRALLAGKQQLNAVTQSYLVLSLGRMGDAGSRKELVRLLKHKDTHARRSATLALGALLEGTRDADTLDAIARRVAHEPDLMVRNFQSIALGRIGWTGYPALYEKLAESSGGVFGSGGVVRAPRISLGGLSERPFAALSVGLAKDRRAYRVTLDRFGQERVHAVQSAFAIALGLYGDRRAGQPLLLELTSNQDPELRSYLVLALGMVGELRAVEEIQRILSDEVDQELLPAAARAAWLLADDSALPALLDRLQREQKPGARRTILYCIGLLGDRTAVEPLLSVLESDREPAHVKRYAAIALGSLLDPHPVRRWARVLEHFNYTAEPNLFHDLLSVL